MPITSSSQLTMIMQSSMNSGAVAGEAVTGEQPGEVQEHDVATGEAVTGEAATGEAVMDKQSSEDGDPEDQWEVVASCGCGAPLMSAEQKECQDCLDFPCPPPKMPVKTGPMPWMEPSAIRELGEWRKKFCCRCKERSIWTSQWMGPWACSVCKLVMKQSLHHQAHLFETMD